MLVRYSTEAPAAEVELPSSRAGLTVLSLDTSPAPVREDFVGGRRLLYPSADHLFVRCCYRVSTAAGTPMPPPEQLFPGAAEIRTLWRRPGRPDPTASR